MAAKINMVFGGRTYSTVFDRIAEAKTPIPKSELLDSLKSEYGVNLIIEDLESKGLVEYANKERTMIKPTEKGSRVYNLLTKAASEFKF